MIGRLKCLLGHHDVPYDVGPCRRECGYVRHYSSWGLAWFYDPDWRRDR